MPANILARLDLMVIQYTRMEEQHHQPHVKPVQVDVMNVLMEVLVYRAIEATI